MYKFSNYPTHGVSVARSGGLFRGLFFRHWNDGRQLLFSESLAQRLGRCAAFQAVALVAALEVIVRKILVKVPLNLLGRLVPLLPALDAEAFVEQGAVHAFYEAVRPRAAHLRRAVLYVVHSKHQFVGMTLDSSAELPTVVGQDSLDLYSESFVKGQHAVVEQLCGGNRHLRGVDLGEGQRAEGVYDDLHVDLAHSLEGSPVESVLIEEFSRGADLYMAHAKVAGMLLEQAYLFFAEQERIALGFFLQPQQSLVAMREIVP